MDMETKIKRKWKKRKREREGKTGRETFCLGLLCVAVCPKEEWSFAITSASLSSSTMPTEYLLCWIPFVEGSP